MLWCLLSLGSALFLSTTDALSKKAMQSEDEYIISWVRIGYSLPFLLMFLPFVTFPHLDRTFWFTIVLSVPLEIIALLLYVKAIKISPLSLTIPFLAFTPAFLVVTAYLVLGEKPLRKGVLKYAPTLSRNGSFWLIGLFYAAMLACQYYAYTLTQASYVIAVKRLSLIIGIMYGGIFFKEIHIRERLLGGAVMVMGVILIAVF
jgi:drug/metabolite transporter (DMT)-like permease